MKSSYIEFSSNFPDEEKRNPIIFLHGMFDSKTTWNYLGSTIAKNTGRKAYALDARNHGDSPWSSEMNYDVLAADVLEFMDDQGIRQAIVIGNSMGGRTAINFALKHPERVEALVIEDMTPKNLRAGPDTVSSFMTKFAFEKIQSYPPEMSLQEVRRDMRDFLIDVAGDKFVDAEKFKRNAGPDMVPLIRKGDTWAPSANSEVLVSMLQSDALMQDLPEKYLPYKGDSLFLYGSKGVFRLEKDPTIPKLFPKAILKKIDRASHLIHFDSPEEFIEAVSQFILNRDLKKSKY